MPRYYFDIWEGDQIILDDEGLDLSSQDLAWAEAARAIADLARDQIPKHRNGHKIIIEVRSPTEPLLAVSVIFETGLLGSQAPAQPGSDMMPSAEEIDRLMEAFALSGPITKAKIVGLVEEYASRSPDLAGLLAKDKKRH